MPQRRGRPALEGNEEWWGRPRGRPQRPEEAAPHRQADLRQAGRRARLRRLAPHRAEVRPRAQACPGGGVRRGVPRARVGTRHLPGRFRELPHRGRREGPRPQAANRDAPTLERPAVRRPHVAEAGRSCSPTTAVLEGVAGARRPEAGEVSGEPPRGREARPRGLEARGVAQALRAAGAQDLRRLRPVGHAVAGGHGARVAPALMSDVGTGKTHMAQPSARRRARGGSRRASSRRPRS